MEAVEHAVLPLAERLADVLRVLEREGLVNVAEDLAETKNVLLLDAFIRGKLLEVVQIGFGVEEDVREAFDETACGVQNHPAFFVHSPHFVFVVQNQEASTHLL